MSADRKTALRQQALAARGKGGDADALTRNLGAVLADYPGQVLAGYWPMRGEADPRPAMRGHDGPLCLPVVIGKARPLVFRRWSGGDLVAGGYGTLHPDDSSEVLIPSVLIVPLAGFDRAGNRLGYGGGFYDRSLQMLRDQGFVTAIGFAFAAQELPGIPAEPFDQPLDLVVTENELIRINH